MTLEAGQIVLVGPGDGRYAGLLGFVESPSYGGQAGVWFRQQGAPPAQFALLDLADLTVVGAMPGTPAAGEAFKNGVAAERARALAVISRVRAEALSHASTAYGSGSEGPENAGRWRACDAIARAIKDG